MPYTLRNLKEDVEDSAARFGGAPDMEARFARELLGAVRTGGRGFLSVLREKLHWGER